MEEGIWEHFWGAGNVLFLDRHAGGVLYTRIHFFCTFIFKVIFHVCVTFYNKKFKKMELYRTRSSLGF